ncbi:paired immunoglobulin-like receptor B [Notamacropus eugenii]|uniref:paired immunoglobulin-like receptor B n=1 Tax=Notamacropus eugenii TaxID=9315 RepID=UPI003B682435
MKAQAGSVLVRLQSPLPPAAGITMTHILSVLLCLGLCLGQRTRAQADTLPRPSLRAENNSLVPLGRSVTLRCQGSVEADHYRLEKERGSKRIQIMEVKSSGKVGEFPIPSVTSNSAGTYYCLYRHSSGWSEFSDPLELVVTGLYDPPSLSALPSSKVASGHKVTFQCQSESWYTMYALYKDGQQIIQDIAPPHGRGSQANFLIPAVNSTQEGTYRCYTFHRDTPHKWSDPSDPLVLRVTGTISPSSDSQKTQFGLCPGCPPCPECSPSSLPPLEMPRFLPSGDPDPQDYTVGNLLRLSLAGLLLLLLVVLLAEAWHNRRGPHGSTLSPALGATMVPTLSALLCLGLCLCWGIWAQKDTLPRPSLRAEPGLVIPHGQPVSLWCKGAPGTVWYELKKEGYQYMKKLAAGREAQFLIPPVTPNTAGSYQCLYQTQSSWSEPSDPLVLTVTDLYDPPSITALPSSEVASGHNVTLLCHSEVWLDTYVLYKDGDRITQGKAHDHARGTLASFSMPAVTIAQEGTYRCYSFQSARPYEWSAPSDPLVLRVTASDSSRTSGSWEGDVSPTLPGGPLRTDPASQDYTVGNLLRLSLTGLLLLLLVVLLAEAWHSRRGRTLPRPSLRAEPGLVIPHGSLCPSGMKDPLGLFGLKKKGAYWYMEKAAVETEAQFLISSMTANAAGSYQCLYMSHSSCSEASDPLVLTVTSMYDLPSLSDLYGSEVASGHNVTLLCQSKEGTYKRYSFQRARPYEWSPPSDPTVLRVTTHGSTLSPDIGATMVSTLSALLCLGLCLCRGIWAQKDTLPRPSLRAEPGLVIPQGKPVSLWCKGPPGAVLYDLLKEGYYHMRESTTGREAQFLISPVTANAAGSYQCLYQTQSSWSEASDSLALTVKGLYDPPSISALPSSEVASGHNVTLLCHSEVWFDTYVLYKDGDRITQGKAHAHGRRVLASFSMPAVTTAQEGTYRCYSFQSARPYEWSASSDPLVLRVTASSASPGLAAGISAGVSAFLTLLFLFLILLLCHRCRQHQARLRNGGREAEDKKITRSSDPEEGTPLEETLYAAVNDDRQTEETRQEDTAAPKREDPQEVTYAQLNLSSLKAGAKDPPASELVEPSLYAALQGAQPEPRGPQDEEAPPWLCL